jgi:hypothetical protein
MKRQLVISYKNLPIRLPIGGTLIVWLLLDRYQIRGPGRVLAGVLLALRWIALVARALLVELQIDVFAPLKNSKPAVRGVDESSEAPAARPAAVSD